MLGARTVSSFNCENVRSSVENIETLCEKCDIVILPETWFDDADILFLTTIDIRFYFKGISSMCWDENIHKGHPYGGLSILWNTSIG